LAHDFKDFLSWLIGSIALKLEVRYNIMEENVTEEADT
jgi:hypothetical protein